MARKRSLKQYQLDVSVELARSGLKSGKYTSIRHAAAALEIHRVTLRRRLSGGSSNTTAKEHSQHLSNIEEKELYKWIKSLSKSGYAPTHYIVKECAQEIILQRVVGGEAQIAVT
jgi:hypothetical protein